MDPFEDPEIPQHYGLWLGEVVDIEDPLEVGRVRFMIPGFIEPESAWAYPLGTLGGGKEKRGAYFVPEVEATVGILFLRGEVDHPYYLTAGWGNDVPEIGSEILTPVLPVPKEDKPKIKAIETERFVIFIDDRKGDPNDLTEGKERLRIAFKGTEEDFIEIDGLTRGVIISGTTAVRIQATGLIELNALQIQFNMGGVVRRVAPVPKDI